jgi:hypothetical protein
MLKHLQAFANSEDSLFTLYCVRTDSAPLSFGRKLSSGPKSLGAKLERS